jgi:sporulation protein YlmC with PRC-barrel domain
MLKKIGLVCLCLALAGCSAARSPGQPLSTPAAADTPAASYAQPQAPAPQPSATPAANNPPLNSDLVATSVAATIAASKPTLSSGGAAAAPPGASAPTLDSAAGGGVVPLTGAVSLLPLDQLLDYSLADSAGLVVGEVKDLVIDLTPGAEQGSVSYLVVSSHTHDDWLYLIPWQVIQIRADQGLVQLPATANQLQTAPGFPKDAWPVSLPAAWRTALLEFWQNPWQAAPALSAPGAVAPRNFLRAKDLFDINVVDPRYFELGEIRDVAIDWPASQPGSGADAAHFTYIILDRDDAIGTGPENIPIPWKRLQLNLQQELAVLNITPQKLASAPAFADVTWPNLYTEPWSADLSAFWK